MLHFYSQKIVDKSALSHSSESHKVYQFRRIDRVGKKIREYRILTQKIIDFFQSTFYFLDSNLFFFFDDLCVDIKSLHIVVMVVFRHCFLLSLNCFLSFCQCECCKESNSFHLSLKYFQRFFLKFIQSLTLVNKIITLSLIIYMTTTIYKNPKQTFTLSSTVFMREIIKIIQGHFDLHNINYYQYHLMKTILNRKMGRLIYPALMGFFYTTINTNRVKADDNIEQKHNYDNQFSQTDGSVKYKEEQQRNNESVNNQNCLLQGDKDKQADNGDKNESKENKQANNEQQWEDNQQPEGKTHKQAQNTQQPPLQTHQQQQHILSQQIQHTQTSSQNQQKQNKQTPSVQYTEISLSNYLQKSLHTNSAYINIQNQQNADEKDRNLVNQIQIISKYLAQAHVSIKTHLDQQYQSNNPNQKLIVTGNHNNTIIIKNTKNHIRQFKILDSQSITEEKMKNLLFSISNFLNPPTTITSAAKFRQYLSILNHDEYLVMTYLPSDEEYQKQIKVSSAYDTFSENKKVPIEELRMAYHEEKYNSGSRKNMFVVVEDRELAKELKINTNTSKIGEKVLFAKTNSNRGMEVSVEISGQKYTVKKIPSILQTNPKIISTKADFHTNAYVNQINYEPDMRQLIRKLRWVGDNRKILVVSCREKRKQFRETVHNTLLRVAKMAINDVIVVTTDNEKILKNCLQIQPDEFVTIRLLDVNSKNLQNPLIVFPGLNSSEKQFFSRWVMSGPFSVENICKFVKNSQKMPQYYENKKNLPTVNATLSKQGIPEEKELSDQDITVTLYEKYGCKGCKLTKSYFQKINQIITNTDGQKQSSNIYQYEVEDIGMLRRAHLQRYNILNQFEHLQKKEPPNTQQHDFTPRVIIRNNKGLQKDVDIGSVVGRVWEVEKTNKQEEQVHKEIVRQIISKITSTIRTFDNHLY